MLTCIVLMLTGIDLGLTGTVFAIWGIDAPPGQDGSAPSPVNLACSRELPIASGIDSPMDRHQCPFESGRHDQMQSRPDSERDRFPKSSGRCRSDRGTALSEWSRCLRTPKGPLTTRDRSQSEADGCRGPPAGSLSQRGRTPFPWESTHSPGCGPPPTRQRNTRPNPAVFAVRLLRVTPVRLPTSVSLIAKASVRGGKARIRTPLACLHPSVPLQR